MALFIQKPIFWNTQNYVVPSGAYATSGYPKEMGYGHEEWNNSPRMLLTEGKDQYRVFHTEGLGAAPLDENAGQTFVFMTVSHDGIQQLVGIAGNAIGLSEDKHRVQRERLAKKLRLHDLWKDAWAVPNVRKQFDGDKKSFLEGWENDVHWIPNWVCPDEFFWWLEKPVTLDARTITGNEKLLGMFGSYTNLGLPVVGRLLDAVPKAQRHEKWTLLADAMMSAPSEPLAVSEMVDGAESVTSAIAKINARRGQGRFRESLMRIWGETCAVSGIGCREVLRASHVKPWAVSTDKQRLDSRNGLLLSANLDALFDKGLITFDDSGKMQLSPRLGASHRAMLGVPSPLRFMPEGLAGYLKYHREKVFQR
ncbi:HNH endonuclease [Burkholderia gladioli]|uniref:HNH endonuclease n=1 Tax=Burkholderia gladioli TaxID=28095 RepID=UPI00163EA18B|nr:HNH endonuclease [Burkholderia gladioli]